ncbi:carboxymuconolactone decarboxylase family protein [Terasakiella sp. SH-1]|uniref:carboxymuconolactone decarboxylase family protein n=1 Tax=Terasakiella sp. SH-1 TaxID=2560057 RepID=UPI00197E8A72|nr:carboxymuconolactone decarboxylase family protein [Terasakiella sp. SH-1]
MLQRWDVFCLPGERDMLTKKHQQRYDAFYTSTHKNEYLDQKTELLVGLSAAMAMNCLPCMDYYLREAKKAGISKGEISEVLAKVMAVAAGQKRLQLKEVVEKYEIDLDGFQEE